MKTKFLLGIIGVCMILPTFAIQAPTYGVYSTREEFDASGEGNVCQVVTDGCSEFNITETGSVGDPIKACKVTADFKFAWTCLTGKDNIYYFGGVPTGGSTTPSTYSTAEEFLKAEGNICVQATDGCNSITIDNGKLGASTLMACMDENGNDKSQVWSCTAYNPSIQFDTTTTLPTPVIVGGDSDSHGCKPSAGYTWDMVKQACGRVWEDGFGMTSDDVAQMQSEKDALDSSALNKVDDLITNYKSKLFGKHSGKDAWQVNMSVLKGITKKLNEIQSPILPGYGMITKTLSDKIHMLKLMRYHLIGIGNQAAFDMTQAK